LFRAYFLDLYRLNFISHYKKLFSNKFQIVGDQFIGLVSGAIRNNSEPDFFKGNLQLDLQSHSFYNPFYERKLIFFLRGSPVITYGKNDYSVVKLSTEDGEIISLNFSSPDCLMAKMEIISKIGAGILEIESI
jgi:hypothetical protein